MLLGQLLVDHEVPETGDDTWVEALLRDPRHYDAVVREVRAVAEEVAAGADDEEPAGPDDATRERFRAFARRQLSS